MSNPIERLTNSVIGGDSKKAALIVSEFKAYGEKTVLFYWLYAVAYMLHIYFDFSGYSDMAIGLGRIFGFRFSENFNYPYVSASITEFWRRWHISLGGWFRDYLYIPLGGNRVKPLRHVFNILVVWTATGFWHGASWNFILWGLLYAVLLLFEKYILRPGHALPFRCTSIPCCLSCSGLYCSIPQALPMRSKASGPCSGLPEFPPQTRLRFTV